jgi:O-antigen/teichoic acid export membrane protein
MHHDKAPRLEDSLNQPIITTDQEAALEAPWWLRAITSTLGPVLGMRAEGMSRRLRTAVYGSAWTMVGYGAAQVLKLVSTLVLARMLDPKAFGLVALVTVFLSGLEMLSDLGVGMDVVQHPRGDDPVFINTAFLIQAGRGVVLWAIASALAYPFAHFYNQPAVLTLLFVGSFSVLVRGFTSGSLWGLTRHVQLGKYNMLTTGSEFFGFLVSLVWAFISPTAWALVMGRVATAASLVVFSHMVAEYPVTTKWDKSAAKDIFAFGAGIVLATGTYFLSGEAERLVVGKFVTIVELGCFSLALAISTAASKGFQQVVLQVFFPMMSQSVREDEELARRHFIKARHLLMIVSAILSVGFIFGSQLFVSIVLGNKYKDAGWMLQLLGVRGALELFTSMTATMLFAVGTSKYAAIGNTAKLVFMAIGLTIAFGFYGFREALWVLTIAPLATYVPFLIGVRKHCKPLLKPELASFGTLMACTVVAAVVYHVFLQARGF